MELGAELRGIRLKRVGAAGFAHLEHEVELLLGRDAGGIVDVARAAGESDGLAAELGDLFDGAPGDVAVAGDGDGLALDGEPVVLEGFDEVVDGAVARGLRADEGAAVGDALAGENALELTGELVRPLKSVVNGPLTFSLPRDSNITEAILAAYVPGIVSFTTETRGVNESGRLLPLPSIMKAAGS
jgi:hypothetical protein